MVLIRSDVLADGQDAMGVGNEAYGWGKGVGIGKECFWNDGKVAEKSEEDPTACVVMYWCGFDVDL